MSNTAGEDLWHELSLWYHRQCDGDWEHQYGIRIQTLDNPGWWMEVDLAETSLENLQIEKFTKELSSEDWFYYEIAECKFRAAGDPSKLSVLVSLFLSISKGRLETPA